MKIISKILAVSFSTTALLSASETQCQCCFDSISYSPSFFNSDCTIFSLDFEALYWYSFETGLAFALKFETIERDSSTPNNIVFFPREYEYFDAKWDPGLRVGLSCNVPCNDWDLFLTWTYYRSRSLKVVDVPSFDGLPLTVGGEGAGNQPALNEFGLINPWINPLFDRVFESINARWELAFNSIDLVLGYKYWISDCFNFRPYAGLRGALNKRNFRTLSFRNFQSSTNEISADYQDNFSTRLWGFGMLGGFQPTWYITSWFALFADLDGALLWGEYKYRYRERYLDEGDANILFDTRGVASFWQVSALLDVSIGLRFEKKWCCESLRTTLDVGWEHHTWFDQNHRVKILDRAGTAPENEFTTYAEETGDLGLGGLVVRARIDF